MKRETMTRREVISFLGIKLPVVLLAVEILPGVARAEHPYTKMTFQASHAETDALLLDLEKPESQILITTQLDNGGRPVGSRIQESDDKTARQSHMKPGTVAKAL
jgi:hypothetical protein